MEKKSTLSFSVMVVLIILAACRSAVITPEPTEEAYPTSTMTFAPIPTSRATATAPIVPPAATATLTLTSTPIIHVVQEGDVLGAIAYQYGVSVQAIQAANGIENPQFLQIGQELVIPVGEGEDDIAPGLLLPTPTPVSLTAQGVGFYYTPVGSMWCLGEVINSTDSALAHVQVHVALYNAEGKLLIDANSFAAAELILVGERSPFGLLFTNPPAEWVNSQVTVVRGEAAGELERLYVPLAVTGADGQLSDPQFRVRGTVQNSTSERTAGSGIVIVTTYDAQGVVTGFRQKSLELETPLVPGATMPFDVLLNFHGDAPSDFNAIALGRIETE